MKFIKVLRAEFRKYTLEILNYYPDHIGNLITTYIFFLGFFFITKDKSVMGSPSDFNQTMIGFLIWFFSVNVIFEASVTISEEKQIGTFEQIMLKPAGILRILISRSLCWTLVRFIQISLLLLIICLTTRTSLILFPAHAPIIAITLIGLYGFGFILAALTMIFTKTGSFSSILQYFLLFFTGSIVGLEVLPSALRIIAQSLPLTLGIEISKRIIESKLTMAQVFSQKMTYMLILNSCIYFCVGLVLFFAIYKIAKVKGVIKKY